MWQRFNEEVRRAILQAQQQAQELGSDRVDVEHLVLGLTGRNNAASRLLQTMGVAPERVHFEITTLCEMRETTTIEPKLTAAAKRVLELAADEARRIGHKQIGTEHLLLGVLRLKARQDHLLSLFLRRIGWREVEQWLRERGTFAGPADIMPVKMLHDLGVDLGKARATLFGLRQTTLKESAFSELGQHIIDASRQEARLAGCGRIDTTHLWLAWLHYDANAAEPLLPQLGLSAEQMQAVRDQIKAQIVSDNELAGPQPRWTAGARRALNRADADACCMGFRYIGPEHLLLGLLHPKDRAARPLHALGLNDNKVRAHLAAKLGRRILWKKYRGRI